MPALSAGPPGVTDVDDSAPTPTGSLSLRASDGVRVLRVTPTYAYADLPFWSSSRIDRFAELIGTAKPTPASFPEPDWLRICALIPITRPAASKAGRPSCRA